MQDQGQFPCEIEGILNTSACSQAAAGQHGMGRITSKKNATLLIAFDIAGHQLPHTNFHGVPGIGGQDLDLKIRDTSCDANEFNATFVGQIFTAFTTLRMEGEAEAPT